MITKIGTDTAGQGQSQCLLLRQTTLYFVMTQIDAL